MPRLAPLCCAVACAALVLAGCDGMRSTSSAKRADGALPPAQAGDGALPAVPEKDVEREALATAVAAGPAAPALPEDVGLGTSDIELGAHALMTAQEEHAQGGLGGMAIADRHRQLYLVWLPQLRERQAMLQAILDERAAEHQRQVKESGRVARHRAELAETEARLAKQVEAERRKTAPILTPEEHDILE